MMQQSWTCIYSVQSYKTFAQFLKRFRGTCTALLIIMALIWLSKSSDDSNSVLDAESGLNDERGKQNLEGQAEHENANSGDVVLEKEALGRRHLDEALQSDSANLSSKTGQKTDSQEEGTILA